MTPAEARAVAETFVRRHYARGLRGHRAVQIGDATAHLFRADTAAGSPAIRVVVVVHADGRIEGPRRISGSDRKRTGRLARP